MTLSIPHGDAQNEPLVAPGIPNAITSAAEGRPLATLIQQLVPPSQRADRVGLTLHHYQRAVEGLANAQSSEDERARGGRDAQVLRGYPFAIDAMREFLTRSTDSTPAASSSTFSAPVAAPTVAPAPLVLPALPLALVAPATISARARASEPTEVAVLNAAPQLFQLDRMTTGIAAVVFEYLRKRKLFVQSGYATMREYAEARLGVRGDNYKVYARAGAAMWKYYEPDAQRVVELIAGGGVQLSPPSLSVGVPAIPSVSVLRELPRALRRADVAEHDSILKKVAAGKCTFEELRSTGRVPADGGGARSAVAPVADTPEAEASNPQDISNDLPLVPLNEVLVAHAKKVERDLVAAANAPPDEALLAQMASGEVSTLLDLQNFQAQLARRAVLLIDSPEAMLSMLKVLRELNPVLTSMSKRVAMTLTTSASLRAQRRFFEKNSAE